MSSLQNWLHSYDQKKDPHRFKVHQNLCFENGKKIYLNADTGDVNFIFVENGDITTIPAHKAILAARSDVLERMFYGGLREPGDVRVCDSTAVAFQEFLQYFYLSDFELTAANLIAVLHLGHKYNIQKCVTDFVQSLIRTLDIENVCTQLKFASERMDKGLRGANNDEHKGST